MEEKKIKHLEMIESIIERLGNNSFQLKGWAVALVAIVGTLSAQGSDKRFFLLAFLPLLAFWWLDAFYLQLERKYKTLYKTVLHKKESEIDFDMDIHNIPNRNEHCYFRCLFSKTESLFYLPILVVILCIAALLFCKKA